MITIRNLTMKYGGRPVIDGLNLDLEKGQIVGLLGENGSGDSDIMMTDTINPLKSKFKASTKLLNKTI